MAKATCGHDAEAHARGLCRKCYDAGRSRGPLGAGQTGSVGGAFEGRQDVGFTPPLGRSAVLDQLQSYVHPAPFDVSYPKAPVPEDAEIITGVIYGDTHGQFIDEEAEAILHGILLDFQPHVVVHVGDAVDCYSISKFDKDPNRKESLQDEIDHARRHLARTRAMVPSSAFFLLEGNHEDRLRRAIWGSSGPQREVLKLREVQKAMTWPTLLQTDQLGIEFVSTFEQPKRDIFPKFLVKHGEVVRKWGGTTAQGEYLKYGKSGASGHIHRLATFMHRDHNGNHMWAESGCLCGLDPAYMRDPDWQQGLLVVSFERETGAFQVEPIYIHRGLAIWRGKAYRA